MNLATRDYFTSRVKVPTVDDCVVQGVLQFSFRVRSRATIDRRNCIAVKVATVKGQTLLLVKVKGQGPFFILTQFDRGRSSQYRLCEGATPLQNLLVSKQSLF